MSNKVKLLMQPSADNLANSIAKEALQASTYCIGLMNGSRFGNDRRAVDRIVRATSIALADASDGASTLLLRLLADSDVESFKRPTGTAAPLGEKSPLGPWYEVALPMPSSQATPWTLEQIPRWLPQWKQQHRLVVIDLGPMHLVASRVLGRLCDQCYLMLGPSVCASHDWITQQIALHGRSGTSVAGTIIATAAA